MNCFSLKSLVKPILLFVYFLLVFFFGGGGGYWRHDGGMHVICFYPAFVKFLATRVIGLVDVYLRNYMCSLELLPESTVNWTRL